MLLRVALVSTATFLDMSQAFDKVWHTGLLYKLRVFIIIIIITGTTALCDPWPSSGFLNNLIFTVWGCQPHVQPPGGPGHPTSSGSYLSTCPAWVALPVATLPPV
jgi:hypothetical protein